MCSVTPEDKLGFYFQQAGQCDHILIRIMEKVYYRFNLCCGSPHTFSVAAMRSSRDPKHKHIDRMMHVISDDEESNPFQIELSALMYFYFNA